MGGSIMPTTDAQRRARDKWLSEKVETINLRVPKGSKEIIKREARRVHKRFCLSHRDGSHPAGRES